MNSQRITHSLRHRIFDRLLFHLENKQIRFIKTGQTLPFILHRQTKKALREKYGLSPFEIERAENSILRDAENLAAWEVTRSVPSALYFDLRATGETDLIETKRAVCVPNFILNAFLGEALEKEFSRSEILACEGFILREGCIRLDIDETLVRRGFMTPQIDASSGLISGLFVFRYPKDPRPFVLRSRSNFYFFGEFD